MSEVFNAKASRAKRPCPLWVDAFQRDTQHLSADEVGAYMLILMAMWTRESCDLPDDDHRLCRVARVSLRLWRERIGPVIRAFLTADAGVVLQKRLRKEAAFIEAEVQRQSDRKRGAHAEPHGNNDVSQKVAENPANTLINNKTASTMDASTEEPRNHPSQQPNNPTIEETSSSIPKEEEEARAKPLLVQVMEAVGIDPASPPKYWRGPAAKENLGIWMALGLTPTEIVAVAVASRADHPDPPDGPKALDGVMSACASQKRQAKAKKPRAPKPLAPPPAPPEPDQQREADERLAAIIKRGAAWAANTVSIAKAQSLLHQGLVTEAELRACGVAW